MNNSSILKKKIDGILLVNKPENLTSNAVLQRVKRLFCAKKAGHTGSLDPIATGMLPVCFGEATKVAQFLLDDDKAYEVEALLGVKTNTGDATGEVIARVEKFAVTYNELLEVVDSFQGTLMQVPPMFSALKHKGQPLYKLARNGIEVAREPRKVQIYKLELLAFDGITFKLRVVCSKGTYIRTLVEDIGDKLGLGANVTRLHRLYTAGFSYQTMFTLDSLLQQSASELASCLLPIDSAIQHLSKIILSTDEVLALFQGKVLTISKSPNLTFGVVRLYSESKQFIGVGELVEPGLLKVKRLLSQEVFD